MSNDNPTRRDRAEQTVNHIAETHGIRYFLNVLLGETDEGRFNTELDDGTLHWLEYVKQNHPNNEQLFRAIITDSLETEKMVSPVENAIIDEALGSVGYRSETGYPRAEAAMVEAAKLPDHLAERLLQSEIDHIEGAMGFGPDDYETLIMLYQTLGERTDRDTTRDRKKLWDELLAFTQYNVRFRYLNGTGDKMTDVKRQWAQRGSTAHNDQLEVWKRETDEDAELLHIDTDPNRLWLPNLDPKPDIETWVRREFW